MAEVFQVFPPLVETNFGNYFPSTAVLAAHLENAGITTKQVDLNEQFALYLLQPGRSAETWYQRDGRLFSQSPETPACSAARRLSRVSGKPGGQSDSTWSCAVMLPGKELQQFDSLKFVSSAMKRLNWRGFISPGKAQSKCWLDEIIIQNTAN